MSEFDLIVLGGGSGGVATANRAASYGAKVAIIEKGPMGGTCVNVGCVPKKIMWTAAGLHDASMEAINYGFETTIGKFNWLALKEKRDIYIKRLNDGYQRGLKNNKVRIITGTGEIDSSNSVRVGDDLYQAKNILIATGGHPIYPEIPGAELGITSDGFFEIEEQPKKVAIVGAGYIAVEFAGLLKTLGSDVSLLIRHDKVLRNFDHTVQRELVQQMEKDGITIHRHSSVLSVSKANGKHKITLGNKTELEGFDQIIWAIGRKPNTETIGLENIKLKTDKKGYIVVNEYQETNVAKVYAVGDITGRYELTPVAIAAGRRLADRLFDGQTHRRLDYKNIPTVIFSHPPIGTVGMTEQEAIATYGTADLKIYESNFKPMYYAFNSDGPKASMKLIVHGADQKIIGCHGIGMGMDEMMQGFAVAIRMGATKADFDDTVAIHPTLAEEMVTMKLSRSAQTETN